MSVWEYVVWVLILQGIVQGFWLWRTNRGCEAMAEHIQALESRVRRLESRDP